MICRGGNEVATMRNKPVSFNMENEDEKQLFEYVNRISNFSGYVKKLMWNDMNRKKPEMERTPSGGMKLKKN
jgi:hypothetical protein